MNKNVFIWMYIKQMKIVEDSILASSQLPASTPVDGELLFPKQFRYQFYRIRELPGYAC